MDDDDDPIRAFLKSHDLEAPPYFYGIVDDLAERYRQAESDHSQARRITDIDNELGDIARSATHLSYLLERLHPETYALMAGDWPFPGQLHPIDREAMTEHIPLAEFAPDDPSRAETGLIRILKDFGTFTYQAQQALVDAWSLRRIDGKLDPGGNWNLYSLRNAHPKWALARDCHYLLTNNLEQCATGTVGGLFYCFVAAVYQTATGKDPDGKGVGLESYVKKVAAAARRVQSLKDRYERVQKDLRRSGLTDECTNRLHRHRMQLQDKLHDAETLLRFGR